MRSVLVRMNWDAYTMVNEGRTLKSLTGLGEEQWKTESTVSGRSQIR